MDFLLSIIHKLIKSTTNSLSLQALCILASSINPFSTSLRLLSDIFTDIFNCFTALHLFDFLVLQYLVTIPKAPLPILLSLGFFVKSLHLGIPSLLLDG